MPSKAVGAGIGIGVAVAVIVAVVILIPLASPTKTSSGSHSVPNPYVNRGFGFSIQYPNGWTATEFRRLDANTTTLVSFNDSKAAVDIVANRMNAGDTLDSLDAKSKTLALSTDKSHSKTVESEGSGTIGGQDAKVRTWLINAPTGEYRQIVYHVVHRGFLLSIAFISPVADYSTELAQFNNSLTSLSFF